ncbi:PGF-CTERM sorting domain-containing protein [Haloferax mediterranei ATCC 33500]|uniref:PGF-CTERM sorting domain-containing protein n=1 Tax=Haloferax mediterranei (strain ATCC 33500 / DSM 1411 / JCM 8866 / NBRC 14739 / NCIMB 2177 / R-4) TaxID=523841 RepID=I3R6G2_HALMT|nr:PGF-CTERM sorting domain-containing protein [Haloferax mediterranei]AFK19822.1 hypothetical protein HFX_2132 [Haloferax mediterranei ATCC 33500]AHZ23204.1 hypothetical protein BM92_11405 [Haloferax mediterranei ATCC 33500]ELZ99784.1 hypothetical protein C439_12449 [Haloferax mediterranei ATCC 33500]MDX5987431.1 PGF-CTERM sorting domain-containing protein [Haloferax mediterranei ATCC 33500]QCQ73933.1 PGF-CTERM sorting domain-containing protein [Haloferax mediterranei ATCC 33500]
MRIRQTNWRTGLTAAAVALVTLLVVTGAAGTAMASPPSPPHRFFGTVEDDGELVSGATVEVVYEGSVVASDTTDSDGYFDLKVPEEHINTSGERTVTVTVRNQSKQFEWQSTGSTEVNFAFGDSDDGDDNTDGGGDGNTGGGGDGNTGGNGDGNTGGGGGGNTGGGAETTTSTSTSTPTTTTTMSPTTSETTQTATASPTASTTAATTTETTAANDTPTTGTGVPGFGVSAALMALLAAALLALRIE